jgi:hypothetical protein
MYLELSRPAGEISRWEKVLKRLTLLNKNYPLKAHNCGEVDFERRMEDRTNVDEIYETVKDTLIDQGVVFFGGYAMTLYSSYMPKALQRKFEKNPDFDVLSEDPETTAEIVKERLEDIGLKSVKIVKKPAIGEIVAPHYEIRVGQDTVAFIYQPIACHSYNVIKIHGSTVKIATIDTMLSFYLAFLYTGKPFYNEISEKMLCTSKILLDLQDKYKTEQKGILKRYSITCYGYQHTQRDMREEKAKMFEKLKDKKGTPEYDEWFFSYRPSSQNNSESSSKDVTNNMTTNNMTTNNMTTNNMTTNKSKKSKKTTITKKRKSSTRYNTRKKKWFF